MALEVLRQSTMAEASRCLRRLKSTLSLKALSLRLGPGLQPRNGPCPAEGKFEGKSELEYLDVLQAIANLMVTQTCARS